MITVIKSLLDKDGDFYKDILSEITSVDNLENISGQELDVFNYLSDSYNNSGFTPSSNLLLEKFPEYEIPLSQSKTLDGRDLQVYLGNVLKQRRDMSLSTARTAIQPTCRWQICVATRPWPPPSMTGKR